MGEHFCCGGGGGGGGGGHVHGEERFNFNQEGGKEKGEKQMEKYLLHVF